MTLVWLTFFPIAAGLIGWALSGWDRRCPRWISLTALLVELTVLLALWATDGTPVPPAEHEGWLTEFSAPWIPRFGVGFHLAMDGLSLVLVMLTAVLGLAAVVCSWTESEDRIGFYHFNLMAVLTGIIGVFLAVDLFLFVVFWEVMLVPMYFLIGVWGHEQRRYAAVKFFLFTQAGGLLLLVGIVALFFVHGSKTGYYTFNYFALLGTDLTPQTGMVIMLAFFAAFAVKLPAVPLHTWLPDAHTEAPTAGSVILAGLLLKTGAYGMIRFVVPLFPDAAQSFAPMAMGLGVIGILYGATLAFAQTDLKRLVAYTSVSHLGFVLLGIFAGNSIAFQGAVMQMVCHGITTGALFILVGMLQERIHTREMAQTGGLWTLAPRLGGVTLIFALATVGLPGLGNFVGEFLTLLGTFRAAPHFAVFGAAGIVLAVIYGLWIMKKVFFGPVGATTNMPDLTLREAALVGSLLVLILWLGLYPQPVLRTTASLAATWEHRMPGRTDNRILRAQYSAETILNVATRPALAKQRRDAR